VKKHFSVQQFPISETVLLFGCFQAQGVDKFDRGSVVVVLTGKSRSTWRDILKDQN
jgi:hypothetical protein